jgi:hypothetical protein
MPNSGRVLLSGTQEFGSNDDFVDMAEYLILSSVNTEIFGAAEVVERKCLICLCPFSQPHSSVICHSL